MDKTCFEKASFCTENRKTTTKNPSVSVTLTKTGGKLCQCSDASTTGCPPSPPCHQFPYLATYIGVLDSVSGINGKKKKKRKRVGNRLEIRVVISSAYRSRETLHQILLTTGDHSSTDFMNAGGVVEVWIPLRSHGQIDQRQFLTAIAQRRGTGPCLALCISMTG